MRKRKTSIVLSQEDRSTQNRTRTFIPLEEISYLKQQHRENFIARRSWLQVQDVKLITNTMTSFSRKLHEDTDNSCKPGLTRKNFYCSSDFKVLGTFCENTLVNLKFSFLTRRTFPQRSYFFLRANRKTHFGLSPKRCLLRFWNIRNDLVWTN